MLDTLLELARDTEIDAIMLCLDNFEDRLLYGRPVQSFCLQCNLMTVPSDDSEALAAIASG